jgi:hypothetical protein
MARLSRFVIPQTEGIFDFFEEMKFFSHPTKVFFRLFLRLDILEIYSGANLLGFISTL